LSIAATHAAAPANVRRVGFTYPRIVIRFSAADI
jgi:hypothetical protein